MRPPGPDYLKRLGRNSKTGQKLALAATHANWSISGSISALHWLTRGAYCAATGRSSGTCGSRDSGSGAGGVRELVRAAIAAAEWPEGKRGRAGRW